MSISESLMGLSFPSGNFTWSYVSPQRKSGPLSMVRSLDRTLTLRKLKELHGPNVMI